MKQKSRNSAVVRKITLVGLLTAMATLLSCIKIPVFGTVSITLVLPVIVIGAAICGPWVGAWLTVIPNLIAFGEAGVFMVYAPAGCVATLLLKGLLAGFLAGFVYKHLSKKHPIGAVTCAAVVAPTVNTLVFVLGCYLFVWEQLVALAGENGIGIGMLLLGLAGLNYVIEMIINVVLCPSILRIIQIATKRNLTKI